MKSFTIEMAQPGKANQIAAHIREELIAHNRSQSNIENEEELEKIEKSA